MLFEISLNNLKFQYSGDMDGQYDVDKDICDKSYDYWKIVPGLSKIESLKDRGKRVTKPIFKLTNSFETKKEVLPPQDLSKKRRKNNYFLCSFSTIFNY